MIVDSFKWLILSQVLKVQLTQEQEKKGKVDAQNERIKRMLNFWHHGPSDRFLFIL